MPDALPTLTPFLPGDRTLQLSPLPDKAVSLASLSAQLAGRLTDATLDTLRRHMAVINSYYSNLIEGNKTQPHEIRAALQGSYNIDPVKRDLQMESLAHIQVQNWIRTQKPDIDTLYTPAFMCAIHREFYSRLPESLWLIKSKTDTATVAVNPGGWRTQDVIVGQHVPPGHALVAELMKKYCECFHPRHFVGDRKIIAVMAAHHRFVWIHPFADGNGRVARLLTDATLEAIGLDSYGAWCLSRGLSRTAERYKSLLALADQPRKGDYDGRGGLTESGLLNFCDYMLDSALDQVRYISNLLDLTHLRTRIQRYVDARNDHRVPGCNDPIKPVAATIIFSAFMHGELERATALELCGMPERSARRLLSQLKSEGLLSETSSKSPLRWEIPAHAEPWYFPGLIAGME